MDFMPEMYTNVVLSTYVEAPCSPEAMPSDWAGVVINAPQQIIPGPGEEPVVPVCGYFRVSVLAAMDGEPMTVHLRRVDTEVEVWGLVADEGPDEPEEPPPADAPKPSREAFEGVYSGGHFNIDAQLYLPTKLLPGVYDVTVTYAGATSNSVRFELKPP